MLGDVAGALWHEVFLVDALAVDVEKHRAAAVFLGKVVAVVDQQPAMRVAAARRVGDGIAGVRRGADIMQVVGDGVDVGIDVGIEVPERVRLAEVIPALDDVPEVRNDAGLGEPVALVVIIEAPGIRRAGGKNLELMLHRMIPPVGAIQRRAGTLALHRLGFGHPHFGMGEDAMAAVKPAIRPPDERVQRFVGILVAPAIGEDDRIAARLIPRFIQRDVEQIRRGADIHAPETHLDAADEIEVFDEDLPRLERAVTIRVFEDENTIPAREDVLELIRIGAGEIAIVVGARSGWPGGAAGIRHALHDPEAPARIPAKGDGLEQVRLGGEQIDREPRRHLHSLERLLRGEQRIRRQGQRKEQESKGSRQVHGCHAATPRRPDKALTADEFPIFPSSVARGGNESTFAGRGFPQD